MTEGITQVQTYWVSTEWFGPVNGYHHCERLENLPWSFFEKNAFFTPRSLLFATCSDF